MSTATKSTNATTIGAAISFLVFLVVGAVPGLLYGGYLGLMMGNALFGAVGELSLITRMMAGGGMLLGFFAVMGLFLVAGGVLGTVFGAGVEKVGSLQGNAEAVPVEVK